MRPSEAQMSLALPQLLASPVPLRRVFPERAKRYPRLRYMGNKHKLLPWIWQNLVDLDFDSVLDLFSGTGSVGYLFKVMGKRVVTNDFLKFSNDLTMATVANDRATLTVPQVTALGRSHRGRSSFIEKTFEGIFFTKDDLR